MFSKSSSAVAQKGHQQLTGEQADEQDRVIAGVQFSVRYVGSTEVAGYNGTGSGKTEIPVAQIFLQQKHKAESKSSRKTTMTLCSKGVSVSDEGSGKLVANFPIDKITYCNVDPKRDRAFVFVARQHKDAPFKAFVFQCESKTKAREAFQALTQAFMINFEAVQACRVRDAYNRADMAVSNGASAVHPRADGSHEVVGVSANGLSPSGPLQGKQNNSETHGVYGVFSGDAAADAVTRSPCADEDFDAEFTQFAELRSRSASDKENTGTGYPITFQELNSGAFGAFKTACLPMH